MKHVAPIAFCVSLVACLGGSHGDHTEIVQTQDVVATAAVAVMDPVVFQCPDDMAEVDGDYCPSVKQTCLQWVDADGNASKEAIPAPGGSGRCGTFAAPSDCLSAQKVHKHYCIDVYEYPNLEGMKPQSWMTWYDVKDQCEAQGKRMCTKVEWTFACEGPEMHPYPYGDGFHRDVFACNFDNKAPKGTDVFKATSQTSKTAEVLDRMLIGAGANPQCVSPFGVHDMPGNIDEWVQNDGGKPYASGLVGGHVFGVRNACRPVTTGSARRGSR